MKKFCFFLFLSLTIASVVEAQDYKKVRVGLGLGYALSTGEGGSGGVLVTFEPGYRIQDNLLVGLRIETAALTRGSTASIVAGTSIGVAAVGSYTINGQYYFGSGDGFRPFGGLGLGLFSLAAADVTLGGTTVNFAVAESKFGFYPRLGFDMSHFTMAFEYNFIPATPVVGTTTGAEVSNSYFGFRIGAFIGGGKN